MKLQVIFLDIVQGEYGDRVIQQVENLIIEAYDPVFIVRLIALQCLVIGGLKSTTINTYERLFIQVRYICLAKRFVKRC